MKLMHIASVIKKCAEKDNVLVTEKMGLSINDILPIVQLALDKVGYRYEVVVDASGKRANILIQR